MRGPSRQSVLRARGLPSPPGPFAVLDSPRMRWWKRRQAVRRKTAIEAFMQSLQPSFEEGALDLMEELELREQYVEHYRRLQRGEDSRDPLGAKLSPGGGALIKGGGDSWTYLEGLIEEQMAEIAEIKERMREAADHHDESQGE
jgi:hypothetical protein